MKRLDPAQVAREHDLPEAQSGKAVPDRAERLTHAARTGI